MQWRELPASSATSGRNGSLGNGFGGKTSFVCVFFELDDLLIFYELHQLRD